MKATLLLSVVSAVVMTACGTVPLGTVYSEQGQVKEQRSRDIVECADEAKRKVDAAENVAADFLAGLSIVAGPSTIEGIRERQRAAFQACMIARGYRVEQPA